MRKGFVFVLMFVLMFSLVAGAGYNIVVPDSDDDDDDPDSPSSSGGSSSNSTVGITYVVNAEQFVAGYSSDLAVTDRFKVIIDAEMHYVAVTGLTATTVSIDVSSDTQQATLLVGDTRRFDVTGDGYYDLSVVLNSINGTSSKAALTVKSIHEVVTAETIEEEQGKDAAAEAAKVGSDDDGTSSSYWWIWVIVVLVLVVLVLVGAWFIYKKKR